MLGTVLDVRERYQADAGDQFAAAMAFFGFLSLFPLLLVALAVAGEVLAGDAEAQEALVDAVTGALPGLQTIAGGSGQVAAALEATVENRQTIGAVGLLLLAFSTLRVVDAGMTATARIAARPVTGNVLVVKLRQAAAALVLGVVALAGAAAAGLTGVDTGSAVATGLVRAGAVVLSFLLDALLFLAAYRLLSGGRGPALRELLPGALVGAVGWTVLKALGATLATRYATRANELYGTLGGVIALLLLLFLAGRLYLYGAELNAVLRHRRHPEPPWPVAVDSLPSAGWGS